MFLTAVSSLTCKSGYGQLSRTEKVLEKFKLTLDKPPKVCYNKGINEREVIKMFYYEIRNVKTQETAQATAKNFTTACHSLGWKPYDCRCVWKANPENAGDPAQY
jgi:hypothetical protein